jgi:mannose-6-phosphate isomerase-like protein (cupin superfamily)
MDNAATVHYGAAMGFVQYFPPFMTGPDNAIAASSRDPRVHGWVFDGADGNQVAYWKCDRAGISEEHVHEFDEYFVVVQGRMTLLVDGERIVVEPGQEYWIPAGTPHSSEHAEGTRTIHCFGGHRAVRMHEAISEALGVPPPRRS